MISNNWYFQESPKLIHEGSITLEDIVSNFIIDEMSYLLLWAFDTSAVNLEISRHIHTL